MKFIHRSFQCKFGSFWLTWVSSQFSFLVHSAELLSNTQFYYKETKLWEAFHRPTLVNLVYRFENTTIPNSDYARDSYILLDGLVCSIVGYFYESRRILASPWGESILLCLFLSLHICESELVRIFFYQALQAPHRNSWNQELILSCWN